MFFNKGCKHMNNFHLNVYYTQHVTISCELECSPFKTKGYEINIHKENIINFNGTTIHFAL